MVLCTHASLCFFALTSSLLVESSDGAMASREEMQGRPSSSPVGSSPREELVVDTGSIAAGAAGDADAAAPPDRGGDGEPRSMALAVTAKMPVAVGDGGRRLRTSGALEAQVLRLRHSAWRLLVGEDAATDGAAASCHSNNVHITCTPPSPH